MILRFQKLLFIFEILIQDLEMNRVIAKFVPRLLMQKYKDYQMLSKFHNPKIMKKIITDDETWIYDYDLKTKFQSLIWKTHNEARLKNIY